jgi:hypothetical protein
MNGKFRSATQLGALAALAFGLEAAAAALPATAGANTEAEQPAYEEVDSFPVLTQLHSWQAIDDDTLIIWTTPFQPYLVELSYPVPSGDLKFSQVIGVTSFGSRVYARFDSLRVAGFRYPIDSIYKMTREEARNLVRQS